MLKFENTANVGDTIRAYDFRPMSDRPDSYLEGEVIEKGPIFAKPLKIFGFGPKFGNFHVSKGPKIRTQFRKYPKIRTNS